MWSGYLVFAMYEYGVHLIESVCAQVFYLTSCMLAHYILFYIYIYIYILIILLSIYVFVNVANKTTVAMLRGLHEVDIFLSVPCWEYMYTVLCAELWRLCYDSTLSLYRVVTSLGWLDVVSVQSCDVSGMTRRPHCTVYSVVTSLGWLDVVTVQSCDVSGMTQRRQDLNDGGSVGSACDNSAADISVTRADKTVAV